MQIVETEIRLTSSGTDSGIAIDRIPGDPPKGPYVLSFRLRSQAGGSGEVFFTVDEKTNLPNGEHLEFDVIHDGQWHEMDLDLQTTETIKALRLDVCSQSGDSTIDQLQLRDASGKSLIRWPSE